MPPTTWRKSSYSSSSDGNCVEVAFARTEVGVRDSKNTGPTLAFDPDRWRAFVTSVFR
jgi:Domain of unknown function (DUF397)